MHRVYRGAEPSGLRTIRHRYTQRWVDFYQNGLGRKPSDRKWIDFRKDLKQVFSGVCGYCERTCSGETDHFRPTSLSPRLVYEWTNWIWACHDCNHAKSNKWPKGGYINPCASSSSRGPEKFFEFDLRTGEILPRNSLTENETARAWKMIDDLKLDGYHHIQNRQIWVLILRKALSDITKDLDSAQQEFISRITARSAPYSSISRQLVHEIGL